MRFFKTDISTPLLYISGGQFHCKKNFLHPKRQLDSFQIIIGVKGVSYIQQDNIQYAVGPGDVLTLLPDHEHLGYESSKEEVIFNWFHFYCLEKYEICDERTVKEETLRLKSIHPTNKLASYAYIPIFDSPSEIEKINIIFHQLIHIAKSNYYTKMGVNFMLTSLLIDLSEQFISKFIHNNDTANDKVNLTKILEFIRVNCTKNISVADLAEEFKYNKDYLSRIFKQKMGRSIHEYIVLSKLTKSKELLVQTNDSIKEIAYALGFENEKYFMNLFKKWEQITPTNYRQTYYRIHQNNK